MYRAASRFDEKYKDEKCPHCHTIGQNYLMMGEEILACPLCRGVFISKETMADFKSKLRDILVAQGQDRSAWVCEECGFRAKRKAGLNAHMRKHDNATDGD